MTQREREVLCLALIVSTEARGEPLEGQIAVAWTVRNRVAKPRWWGKSVIEVCTKPGQYDGYTLAVPRFFSVLKDVAPQHLWIAEGVLDGLLAEPAAVKGATHYFNRQAVAHVPEWSKKLPRLGQIGNHEFYVEV